MSFPLIAGSVSTLLFALATLPMLAKAVRTRNLESYSLGHMALSNIANLVHSVYVFSLPPGPIWILHCFYCGSTALMLTWYLRFRRVGVPGTDGTPGGDGSPALNGPGDAEGRVAL